MINTLLIGLSIFLALISYVVYVRAILAGDAKPHRTTRFCTALITILAVVSLYAQGSTVAVWFSGVFAVGSIIIFLLTIKYGMGGWAKTDIICLVISLLGIIIWQITKDPVYGLVASIAADLFGQIPMLIKTHKYPETEVWTFYFLDVLSAFFSIVASGAGGIKELAYPLYIMAIDGFTILLILRPRILSRFKK